MTNKYMKQLVD